MVVGRTPYAGSSAAVVMTKHLNEEVPNPRDERPELSMGLVRLVEKMMAKDRKDRYADPEALIRDVNLVISGKSPAAVRLATGRSAVRGFTGATSRTRPMVARTGTRPVEAVRGKGSAKLIVLGVGLLLLMVVGVALGVILSADPGPGELPPPDNGGNTKTGKNNGENTTKPPPVDPREIVHKHRLARLEERLQGILAYRKAKPKDFAGAADRLKSLIGAAGGTEYQLKGQRELDRVYDAQFQETKARSKVLEDAGKLQEAYDVFNELPLVKRISDPAGEEQRRIRELATNRYEVIKNAAWAKLGPKEYTENNRGDLAGAEKHLKTALALKMAHVVEAVNEELPKLKAEHQRRLADLAKRLAADRARELKELRAKFVPERDKIFKLAAERDSETRLWKFGEARAQAQNRLLQSRFKPFAAEARRIVRDLTALEKSLGGLRDLVAKRTGERLTLELESGSEEGTVTGATANGVNFRPRTAAFGAKTIFFFQLKVKSLGELAGLKADQAVSCYWMGVLAFYSGRHGQAAEFLKAAAKDAKLKPDADYYLGFAQEAYRRQREKEAGELLDECRRIYAQLKAGNVPQGDARWGQLVKKLEKLKQEYKDTDAVKKSLGK
jgi:hypothetical protein